MKNLLLLIAFAFIASCHKSEMPKPVIINYSNSASIIGIWNSHLRGGVLVNGVSNKVVFTNDSLEYSSSNPLYPGTKQINFSYTSGDTIFINSTPLFTFHVKPDSLYISHIPTGTAYVLTQHDTTNIITTHP